MISERTVDALELMLELIDLIDGRLDGLDRRVFLADRNEVDLTAFRLSHIGETARRLPADLTTRHPHIPWKRMYDMRNVIAHDYGAIDPVRIWKTATEDLNAVAEVCRLELKQFGI